MNSIRELGSTSIRGIGRDVVIDEGRSATTGSVGSVGLRKTKKKKFNAPQCHYGTNAILFLSSTQLNPNRLFFGCANFKSSGSHCKYFAWLDDYIASFDTDGTISFGFDSWKQNEDQLVNAAEMFGGRVKELEHRVTTLELQTKRCKHMQSGHRCFNASAMVVAFFCGIVIANVFRVFG